MGFNLNNNEIRLGEKVKLTKNVTVRAAVLCFPIKCLFVESWFYSVVSRIHAVELFMSNHHRNDIKDISHHRSHTGHK